MRLIASTLLPALLVVLGATAVACRDRHAGAQADAAASAASSAAPTIVASEIVYNFGKAKQGADVEHVFKVRNEGAGELDIEQAKGS